jgi:hypothetical protein
MRAADLLFIVVLVFHCPIAFCDLPASDKEEKERREKEEKQLAELDRLFEKEDWAIERKKSINAIAKELQKAERILLYRLNPKPLPEKSKDTKRSFHNHAILLEVPARTAEQRKEVASFLGKSLHWNEGRKALCFNPRHGAQVVLGKRTLDFLICFECCRVDIYEGGKFRTSLPLKVPKENSIQKILREVAKNTKKEK